MAGVRRHHVADLRRCADAARRRGAGAGLSGSAALPYDEAGSGEPVVLLHAGVGDRRLWAGQLDPIAEAGYRAIAFDLPGFGEAEVRPGAQAPWNDVLAAMRDLGLEQAALVGNSFGGAVALRAAVVAPAAVSKLALISVPAPGIPPSSQLEAAWDAEGAALGDDDIDGAVESVLAAWVPERLHPVVRPMQRRALELQAEAEDDVSEAPDPIAEIEPLRALAIPALVAYGEHDMIDFRAGAEAIADGLPDARLEMISGVGHLAPLEAPEAFRELMLNFLAEQRSG